MNAASLHSVTGVPSPAAKGRSTSASGVGPAGPVPDDGSSAPVVRAAGRWSRRAGRRVDTDDEFVRRLYLEHGSVLLGYLIRLTGDCQLAEDVVQETLVRAWRHRDRMTAEYGSVRSWLITVARNIVTDQRRARRARPQEVAELHDRPDGRDQAEHVLDTIVIADSLRTLSGEHRDAVVEVYLRGRSVAEAAEALGIPPGTVKSRVHYALRALRPVLGVERGGSR
jgi:RNA polymerase sigma-70 factor (ECF subfamily)